MFGFICISLYHSYALCEGVCVCACVFLLFLSLSSPRLPPPICVSPLISLTLFLSLSLCFSSHPTTHQPPHSADADKSAVLTIELDSFELPVIAPMHPAPVAINEMQVRVFFCVCL